MSTVNVNVNVNVLYKYNYRRLKKSGFTKNVTINKTYSLKVVISIFYAYIRSGI